MTDNTEALPPLPQHLLDLIGWYGSSHANGESEVRRIARWQELIAAIKAYAALSASSQAPAAQPRQGVAISPDAAMALAAAPPAQPQQSVAQEPLTEEQVIDAMRAAGFRMITLKESEVGVRCARAIERAHGIGKQEQERG